MLHRWNLLISLPISHYRLLWIGSSWFVGGNHLACSVFRLKTETHREYWLLLFLTNILSSLFFADLKLHRIFFLCFKGCLEEAFEVPDHELECVMGVEGNHKE